MRLAIRTTFLTAALLATCAVGAAQGDAKPVEESKQEATPVTPEALAKELARWKLEQATEAADGSELGELESIVKRAIDFLNAHPKAAAMGTALTEAQAELVLHLARTGDRRLFEVLDGLHDASNTEDPSVADSAMAAVLNDERVARVVQRTASRTEIAPYGKDKLLEERIERAVALGDHQTVLALRQDAVPALKQLARELVGTQPTEGQALDPLELLFQASIDDGFEVALELMGSDDIFVRRLTARSILKIQPFRFDDAYQEHPEFGDRLRGDSWNDLIPLLAAEPNVPRSDIDAIMRTFLQRGYVPERNYDQVLEAVERNMPADLRRYPAVLAFFRWVARADSELARVRAAEALGWLGEFEHLFAMAIDASADIQRIAANALGGLKVQSFDTEKQAWRTRTEYPELTVKYWETVEHFWLHPKADDVARRALDRADDLLSYMSGSQIDKRHAEALIPGLDNSIEVKILLRYSNFLAEQHQGPFLSALIEHIAETFSESALQESIREVILHVPIENRAETALETIHQLRERGLLSVEDDVRWTSIGLGQGSSDPALVESVLDYLATKTDTAFWARFAEDRSNEMNRLPALADADSFEEILMAAVESGASLSKWLDSSTIKTIDDESLERMLHVNSLNRGAVDSVLDELARRRYSAEDPSKIAAAIKDDFVAKARDRNGFYAWKEAEAIGVDTQELLTEISHLPGIEGWMIDSYDASITNLDNALNAHRIVEESAGLKSWHSDLHRSLFEHLVESEDPRRFGLILEATAANKYLWRYFCPVATENRRSEDFALLREFFRRGDQSSFGSMVDVTASYLTDEAADLLLELAAKPLTDNKRAKVMSGLDTIREYQEAAARWQKNSTLAERRLAAVDALIEIISDATQATEARAEAFRGLGLLGATEELPRLITALGSDTEAIRKAAREAIDRLNAAQANAGGDD